MVSIPESLIEEMAKAGFGSWGESTVNQHIMERALVAALSLTDAEGRRVVLLASELERAYVTPWGVENEADVPAAARDTCSVVYRFPSTKET